MTDVEMESMSGSPSGTKSPSLPPQTAEYAKLDLLPDQMSAINHAMCEESHRFAWSTLLNLKDPQLTRQLMSTVLARLALVLSTKGFNTSGLNFEEADTIINGFNQGELKEWEAVVRKGVDMGNWGDLAAHRTYHPILNGRMAFRIFISKVDRYMSTAFLRQYAPGKRASDRKSSPIPQDPQRCKLPR